jgi:hypothetical protein
MSANEIFTEFVIILTATKITLLFNFRCKPPLINVAGSSHEMTLIIH